MSKKILAVIWDLDNCLADDAHRVRLIDWGAADDARWARYHEQCIFDKPGAESLEVFSAWHAGNSSVHAIFLTARPERLSQVTQMWIEHNITKPLGMIGSRWSCYMRPENDPRSSPDFKRDSVVQLMKSYDILCAYDDREDVLDEYRALGIRAQQLKIHDINAHDPPTAGSPRPDLADDIAALAALRPSKVIDVPAADEILAQAADTFRRKSEEYGHSYRHFGRMLAAAFPQGLELQPGDAEAWGRLAIVVMVLGKMQRYSANLSSGGHQDSAHDACVYAAMLDELTRAARPKE